jgi:ankyrin repeat protein
VRCNGCVRTRCNSVQGADVDAADKDGITALMEASIAGHLDVVKALMKAGAGVDKEVPSGATALLLAAGESRC